MCPVKRKNRKREFGEKHVDEKYSSEEVGDEVEGEEEPQKPLTSNKSNNSKPRVVVVLAGPTVL